MSADHLTGDLLSDYPYINNRNNENKYLLSIYPTFHTRLFPDSKLVNEALQMFLMPIVLEKYISVQ